MLASTKSACLWTLASTYDVIQSFTLFPIIRILNNTQHTDWSIGLTARITINSVL